MQIIEIQRTILSILQKHHITKAGIFGSFAKAETTEASDVDILVELGTKMTLLDFVGIKLELEDALQREVDLVEYQSIKPALREQILKEEIRIYG
ncbi:MAG: nucleotidyltransferase family protein [Saprospiraceae bacterium]|nr:nucleotidyltransferase family protein [Saprospiraceae bacterium]